MSSPTAPPLVEPTIPESRAAALAALAAVVAFLPILFIPYAVDSMSLVVGTPGMRSWGAAAAIFDPAQYNGLTGQYSFRPVACLSYLLDINLGGLRPWFSHAIQIALHALCASMLARVAYRLNAGPKCAAAAGILFAVHPVVTEAVNCAGFRADLLATLSVLGGALCALSWERRGTARTLLCAAAWFLFGVLSKESAATALAIVPGIAFIATSDSREGRRRAALLLAALVPAFVAFIFVWMKFHAPAQAYDRLGGSLASGLANFMYIFWTVYLPTWLFPIHLKTFHEYMPPTFSVLAAAPTLMMVLFGAAAYAQGRTNSDYARSARRAVLHEVPAVGLANASISFAQRSPLALFGLLWIAAGLAPYSQLVAMPDPIAERFLYLAHVGVALGAAALWGTFRGVVSVPKWSRIAALALLSLLILTYRRHYDWRDERSLNIANFEHDSHPTEFGLRSLATFYMLRGEPGDLDKAMGAASRLRAEHPDVGENLRISALVEMKRGNHAETVAFATRATELAPESAIAWRVLAAALRKAEGPDSLRAADADRRAAAIPQARQTFQGNAPLK